MLRAGVGLSTDGDPARAAAEAAACALESGGLDGADVLLVFATSTFAPGFTRVTRIAAQVAAATHVVGCSAAGVIAGDREIEQGPGVAVLALRGTGTARRFLVPLARGRAEAAAEAIAAAVRDAARPGSLLLLFADTYHLEADALLGGLARHLPGVRVVGGGASEDGTLGQVSVFAGDAATSAAVSGVLLAGETTHSVGVTQAVRRVGPVRRVTSARGNWVLTLDSRPAYEAFAAVVPEPLLAQPRRALAVVLACMVVGEDDFIARHLAGLDPEHGAVALPAPVAPGMELFFGVRDPMGARDDLQRMLARAESAWGATRPVGGLYVSCVGRGRGFYGVPGLDTAYIRRQLGALPIAGFFSGAEFAPGGGVSLLHQYTGVLTMLGWGGARV